MAKMIRMAHVAKHLGIPSQQLRTLLSEVNFGIKPTDREVEEGVASGIVRVASQRLGIKCEPFPVESAEGLEDEALQDTEETEVSSQTEKKTAPSALSKLSTIAEKSKEDIQKKKQEQQESPKKPGILRKIEISPEAAAEAKERMKEQEEERRRLKEEREQESLERKLQQKKKQEQIFTKKEGTVELPEMLPVKEFAEKVGVPTSQILKSLIKNGVMATLNTTIDFETAAIIAEEFEVQVRKGQIEASSESLFLGNLKELLNDEPENMTERPPVIVVMGHVDHGKTSILDAIRKTKVVEGEAGGITQHIGAYQVEKNNRLITFLDTPGHEAFTSMRARGAKTADIAILVVAGDEGIKPQTVEAINHAKDAEVPIIVAMNKMDKQNVNPDKVKGELAEHELQPEDWGGETPVIPVSAYTGKGIEDLLEIVVLQADLLELKANSNRSAVGTVVEAHLDPSMGPVATILINTGTLKVKDTFLLGTLGGRIKTMIDDTGTKLSEVPPSGAVQISGISKVPEAGDILQVFENEKLMKAKLYEIKTLHLENHGIGLGVSEIINQLQHGEMKFLKVVLKADTNGSLQAVEQALAKIKHEEVGAKIIHSAVGAITETDVMMAAASQGVVIGFNVIISPRVKRIAEKEGVEIMNYDIIYKLTEDVEKILTGLLEPEEIETIHGSATVKAVFYTQKKMMIVGCSVDSGKIKQKAKVRIFRKGEGENEEGETIEMEVQAGEGVIASLQHFESKVKEVEKGNECGIQFEGKISIEEGDRIECYQIESRIRTLK